jgi:DNA polymerase delta subunit 2
MVTRRTGNDGQRVRIILVPRFSRTGELVLVNTRTLDVRVVQIVAR